jgi:hypothetical protein
MNGKETYQMLRRGQDRDVFDPLIVGFAGSIHALKSAVFNVLLLCHGVPLDRFLKRFEFAIGQKKTTLVGGLLESFERLEDV